MTEKHEDQAQFCSQSILLDLSISCVISYTPNFTPQLTTLSLRECRMPCLCILYTEIQNVREDVQSPRSRQFQCPPHGLRQKPKILHLQQAILVQSNMEPTVNGGWQNSPTSIQIQPNTCTGPRKLLSQWLVQKPQLEGKLLARSRHQQESFLPHSKLLQASTLKNS